MKRGELTRRRILDQAVCLASQYGLEGLSIGYLATLLGLSKAGLFAHFGSKQSLQEAVLLHAAELYRQRVIAPLTQVPPGVESVRALLEACLDWIDESSFAGGCPIIGACFELGGQEGALLELLRASQASFQRRLARMFAECGVPDNELQQCVFEFRAITLGYQYASRTLGDSRSRELARRAFNALLSRQSEGTLHAPETHAP